MKTELLEERMRALEHYHGERLLRGAWVVVRVDGRGFTRFTNQHFERPFDARFRDHMLLAARALVEEMGGLYAYTESDEISVAFPPRWNFFDRSLEKIVSLSAAIASSTFTLAAQQPVQFDSRVWLGVDQQTVVDYFRWRQMDAARCALNGWCYWTLRKEGHSAQEATATLERMPTSDKHELLFQRGINFAELPAWQRRGMGLRWESYAKPGLDPRTGAAVSTTRRHLVTEAELPMKEGYAEFLHHLFALPDSTPQPNEISQ